jgi:hypothetical protein
MSIPQINFKQGSSLNLDFVQKDEDGNVVDITDWEICCSAKNVKTDDELFNVGLGNGITKTDSINGAFNLYIQETSSFIAGYYYLDVLYTLPNSSKDLTETISLEVKKGITLQCP